MKNGRFDFDQQTASFVSLRQQREQDFHLKRDSAGHSPRESMISASNTDMWILSKILWSIFGS